MCPQDFGTKIQNNAHHLTGFKRSWYTIKNTIVYLWQSTQCFISTKGEPPNWTRARKFNYIVNVFTICITYVNRENCCSFYPSVLLFMHNKTKAKKWSLCQVPVLCWPFYITYDSIKLVDDMPKKWKPPQIREKSGWAKLLIEKSGFVCGESYPQWKWVRSLSSSCYCLKSPN